MNTPQTKTTDQTPETSLRALIGQYHIQGQFIRQRLGQVASTLGWDPAIRNHCQLQFDEPQDSWMMTTIRSLMEAEESASQRNSVVDRETLQNAVRGAISDALDVSFDQRNVKLVALPQSLLGHKRLGLAKLDDEGRVASAELLAAVMVSVTRSKLTDGDSQHIIDAYDPNEEE